MRTNFAVSHSIKIIPDFGKSTSQLTFIDEVTGKTLRVKLEEYQVEYLAKEIRNYTESRENEMLTRLSNLKTATTGKSNVAQLSYTDTPF